MEEKLPPIKIKTTYGALGDSPKRGKTKKGRPVKKKSDSSKSAVEKVFSIGVMLQCVAGFLAKADMVRLKCTTTDTYKEVALLLLVDLDQLRNKLVQSLISEAREIGFVKEEKQTATSESSRYQETKKTPLQISAQEGAILETDSKLEQAALQAVLESKKENVDGFIAQLKADAIQVSATEASPEQNNLIYALTERLQKEYQASKQENDTFIKVAKSNSFLAQQVMNNRAQRARLPQTETFIRPEPGFFSKLIGGFVGFMRGLKLCGTYLLELGILTLICVASTFFVSFMTMLYLLVPPPVFTPLILGYTFLAFAFLYLVIPLIVHFSRKKPFERYSIQFQIISFILQLGIAVVAFALYFLSGVLSPLSIHIIVLSVFSIAICIGFFSCIGFISCREFPHSKKSSLGKGLSEILKGIFVAIASWPIICWQSIQAGWKLGIKRMMASDAAEKQSKTFEKEYGYPSEYLELFSPGSIGKKDCRRRAYEKLLSGFDHTITVAEMAALYPTAVLSENNLSPALEVKTNSHFWEKSSVVPVQIELSSCNPTGAVSSSSSSSSPNAPENSANPYAFSFGSQDLTLVPENNNASLILP